KAGRFRRQDSHGQERRAARRGERSDVLCDCLPLYYRTDTNRGWWIGPCLSLELLKSPRLPRFERRDAAAPRLIPDAAPISAENSSYFYSASKTCRCHVSTLALADKGFYGDGARIFSQRNQGLQRRRLRQEWPALAVDE